MKLKAWLLWLFAAICFTLAGITHLVEKQYLLGTSFVCIGGSYFVLSIINYKNRNKSTENILSGIDLENMNNELQKLIVEGKKIQAIKKCRMITDLGLKEAKEYVDLLSESTLK